MTNLNFQIGQVVNYTNGNLAIYTGQVVKITDRSTLVVVDDAAGMELFNAGCAIGTEITFKQVK